MGTHPKRGFWRVCRIYFRRFRITVWVVVLLLLGALIYLNQVGLPGFVKRPVLEKLRARGLDLQFSRLRLRWYEGIVAENVRFGRPGEPLGPSLTMGEVQVLLNLKALTRLQLQVDALVLRWGRLFWPLADTNQGPSSLSAEGIQTHLRFLPNDQWALDNFRAQFAGADIQLTGVVTNASAVREWGFVKGERTAPTPAEVWQKRLRNLADTLERIRFSTPPELMLDVRGDARDVRSFSARLHVAAPGAETPWGAVSGGHFSGHVFPAISNETSHAEFTLEATDSQTPWGAITNVLLRLQLHSVESPSNLINGALRLSASRIKTPWVSGTNAILTATWIHELTNPVPLLGESELQCAQAETDWGRAGQFRIHARFATPPNPRPPTDASLAWWTNLQPYSLQWECRLAQVESHKLAAEEITCAGDWSAPRLSLTNFQARLYGGHVAGQAELDVATRALSARVDSDLDPRRLGPLLAADGHRWLQQLDWEQPPQLNADVNLVLPAWTNRQPDWPAEVQPTLCLRGEVRLERGGTYYTAPRAATDPSLPGLKFTAVQSHVLYSNFCWHLSDLILTRPEGGLVANLQANDRTKDFHLQVSSTLDVRAVRPILEGDARQGLDYFTFTQAPALEAEVWGRFHEPESIGFKGRIALSNFTFRGESFTSVRTTFQYTNACLQFFEPRILCNTQQASAAGLLADFKAQFVYLTNAYSTTEPRLIAACIGPHIVRAIEPYQFLRPPVGHVYGTIPMRGEAGADLHFDLDGGPFHWWKFTVPHIAGHVHWAGEALTLTNIQTDFYQGKASGAAAFDFRPGAGADFRFQVAMTNALFPALMTDLASKTNHLEGRLSGNLFVTAAKTADWRSVNGHGNLNLRDGLIWDIPLFGIFSPVLNSIVPGLGNSRATAGTCNFVITNGVCRTDDLEFRSATMRLQYRGTVDLESRVNARVDAELLRDMWLFGPVVSTVFWPVTKMFEYKVAGNLDDPKMDPVFIVPRLVLFPFHPFRTLKGLFPEEPVPSQTNAPPQISVSPQTNAPPQSISSPQTNAPPTL